MPVTSYAFWPTLTFAVVSTLLVLWLALGLLGALASAALADLVLTRIALRRTSAVAPPQARPARK